MIGAPGAPGGAPSDVGLTAPPDGWRGLSSGEAASRLVRDGRNVLAPEPGHDRFRRLVGPLTDPMVLLLLLAAPTYLAIGETTDAVVAFAALVPVTTVGWLLEARAEHALAQLRRLTASTAVVWRDGGHAVVPAEEIVAGDLVWLREGDVVPADADVVDLTQLLVDESPLTGESLPVDKSPGTGNDESRVFAGTTVLSGRAVVQVTATGGRTRYGAIGSLLGSARPKRTPLQQAVARLVRGLAVVAVVFCAAVMAAELIHGHGWGQAVIAGVSLAIAAIPEEFPIVYALYLSLGAWRLAKERALVRHLPGVETLGSTTVICTDKTGTLTEGRLAIAGLASVAGDAALLEAAVLACEPAPFDPLEIAIAQHARPFGIEVPSTGSSLVVDHPFDARGKYLTHVWRLADGSHRVAAKGSIEGILHHADVGDAARRDAHDAHARFAADGMRVLAVAAGELPTGPTGSREADEAGLSFVGLLAFTDPVREGVADALSQCRDAGVRVIVITGDHPATAHAVVEGLGLPHADEAGGDLIATGDDLDAASPEELDRLVATANVFARTRPEQKHLLVQALRRRGEVVAMTGDGINDAPALREADIGVAMGERGTEVAREAATIVLLDDNFSTIVGAVRDGRRIFDNLSHAFAYLIAFHPPLLLAALVVPLLGKPLLLLPVHLVTLELLLHPVISLVFEADPAGDDVMRRPPSRPVQALAFRRLWPSLAVGLTVAVGVVAVYLGALDRDWPVGQARALAFTTLLAAQPLLIVSHRRMDRAVWAQGLRPTRMLVTIIGLLVAAAVASVYLPPLARLLELSAFPAQGWAIAVAVAALTTLWFEPLKARRA